MEHRESWRLGICRDTLAGSSLVGLVRRRLPVVSLDLAFPCGLSRVRFEALIGVDASRFVVLVVDRGHSSVRFPLGGAVVCVA